MNTPYLNYTFGQNVGDIIEGNMAQTMANLFMWCSDEYNATEKGCQAIIDEWKVQKGDAFDARFKNIEGYDPEEHQIVLNVTRLRDINPKVINDFWYDFVGENDKLDCRVILKIDGLTKSDWYNKYDIAQDRLRYAKMLPATMLDYHGVRDVQEVYDKARWIYRNMTEYIPETEEEYKVRRRVVKCFGNYKAQFCDEPTAELLNGYIPELKAVSGQKMSKIALKVLRKWGINNDLNFEKQFAKYADAINPLEVPEKMIISWNPMDYLTMSFGNSWTSCHSIDKDNRHGYRENGSGYGGGWSAGTLSYMLDKTSVVVYSLNDKANKPYWNEPKLRRQMFHINLDGDTFIQGRSYPNDQTDQGCYADYSDYKIWREIVQDVISRAYECPNMWKNKKGSEICARYTSTYGCHYPDYTHYANPNINYRSNLEYPNAFAIGHNPICPSCGEAHTDGSEWCTCGDCRGENYYYCANCNREVDPDDCNTYYIDGNYYCEHCIEYCEWHDEYEVRSIHDYTYIDNYGDVCEDALSEMIDEERVARCDTCGDYCLTSDLTAVEEDGVTYYYCRHCH